MEKTMKIVLSNNNLQGVDIQSDQTKTVINYGTRLLNADLSTGIEITDYPDGISLRGTCGCTTTSGGNGKYTLRYDAKSLGTFSKVIQVVKENVAIHSIILRGTIIR